MQPFLSVSLPEVIHSRFVTDAANSRLKKSILGHDQVEVKHTGNFAMLDDGARPAVSRTGLILKPLPDRAEPFNTAYRIGGAPNLPEGLSWPMPHGTPYHFFAQVDLALLRQNCPAGTELPDMPETGTLFIFLCLEHWMDDPQPVILYTQEPLESVPERAPPENLAHLLDNDTALAGLVHEEGVSEDGKLLRRQNVDVLPFTSFPDGWLKDDELSQRQMDELETLLGRLTPLPDPHAPPEGVEAPWMSELPLRFRQDTKLAKAHLDWEMLFDWSKEIYMGLLDLIRDKLRDNVPQNMPPQRRPGIDEINELWERANWEHHKYQFWLLYLQVFLNPDSDYPFDFRLRHFMEISQMCRGKVPARVRRNFCALIADIEQAANDGTMVHLEPVALPEYAAIAAEDLAEVARKALAVLKPRRTGPEPRRPAPANWDEYVIRETTLPERTKNNYNLAGTGIIPLQMFGFGYLLQSAAYENQDKELLLQVGDPFGTPLSFANHGAVIQIWITSHDLKAGQFDSATATWEFT
ncbi:DUF1963 domain-containing protein [Aquicoccus porphyridii]|uniref:DUF1963 domain-containing protein n=1 Tax=Aquicoccus porphyridii TaxID=1852029 RepID=A0A5A9Z9T9_9RHOB|nr:DUF1963 domain-containing protein [Aquicoccus porphyridii]